MEIKSFADMHKKYKEYKKHIDKSDKHSSKLTRKAITAEEIKNIYLQIKHDYSNDKNLDITLEKIYVKNKLDRYLGDTIQSNKNFLVALGTVLLTSIINTVLQELNYEFPIKILLLILLAIIIVIITIGLYYIFDYKNAKVENYEHLYYKICLEVLEEIEKNQED